MSRVSLKHIVDDRDGFKHVLTALVDALGTPLRVEDASGKMLFGERGDARATIVETDPEAPARHVEG